MSTRHSHLDPTAMALLVLLCASWGLQQVAIKVSLADVPPVLQAGLRSIVAMVLVWGYLTFKRQRLFADDGTAWWGLLAGALFAAEFMLIFWGLEFTTASRAVIFLYIAPFVVAAGVHLLVPGERLRPIQGAGLLLAFLGVIAAFGEGLTLPDRRQLIGDAMLIGGGVLWAATTLIIKTTPLVTVSPSRVLLYQLLVSALALPLGALALGEPVAATLLSGQWSALTWASLAYQGIWVAAVTYLAWFWLIRHYPASRISSFTFLTPLFGVMFGALLLGEPLTPILLLALVLVGTGIYLVNRK